MSNLVNEKSEMILVDTSSIGDRFGWLEDERGIPVWVLDREDTIERLQASLERIVVAGKKEPYPTEVERLRAEYKRVRALLREGERELDMQLSARAYVMPEDVDVWESPTLDSEVQEELLNCSEWTSEKLVNWIEGMDLLMGDGQVKVTTYLLGQLLLHREVVKRQGKVGILVNGVVRTCTTPVHKGWNEELARLEKACSKLTFTKVNDLVVATEGTVVSPEGEDFFGDVGISEDEMIQAIDAMRRFEHTSLRTGISTVELARAEMLSREE